MNTIIKLGALTAFAAGSFVTAQAQTIADWTFETSQPAGTPGAGVTYTNIAAEVGTGTASAKHVGNAVYSTPAGNGSAHSFSSTVWAVGDYYQFSTSTLGYNNGIAISFDQTSSGTGPGSFTLQYSTDGVTFTPFTTYAVLDNGLAPNASWNATTYNPAYTSSDDLSSITALENASVVYFRLVDASTTSSSGGIVGTGGTDRVDNFVISSVPEPSSIALTGIGGLAALIGLRRRKA